MGESCEHGNEKFILIEGSCRCGNRRNQINKQACCLLHKTNFVALIVRSRAHVIDLPFKASRSDFISSAQFQRLSQIAVAAFCIEHYGLHKRGIPLHIRIISYSRSLFQQTFYSFFPLMGRSNSIHTHPTAFRSHCGIFLVSIIKCLNTLISFETLAEIIQSSKLDIETTHGAELARTNTSFYQNPMSLPMGVNSQL